MWIAFAFYCGLLYTMTRAVIDPVASGSNNGDTSLDRDEFEELKCLITSGNKNLDSKIDLLRGEISSAVESIREELSPRIEENALNIQCVKRKVDTISPCVTYLMVRDNEVHQRDRNPNCRILGLAVPDDISKYALPTQKYIFDQLFGPMLDKAASDGHINSTPENYLSVVSYAHILPQYNSKPRHSIPGGPRVESTIPTILCKLEGRGWKKLCFMYKKGVIDSLNKLNGTEIRIFDDITKPNLDCMSKINKMPGYKAYFRDGYVRFNCESESTVQKRVNNPYGRTLDEMCKQLYPPTETATDK